MGKLTSILSDGDRNNLASAWSTTEAAEDFAPLPAGEYVARVVSGDLENSRTNATPGYKLTFRVLEGEHEGRQFWHEIWLTYDHQGRGWYRKEPHRDVEIKDPFEQAWRNAHALENEIRRESFRGQNKIPCPYGYAVIFPHCEYTGGVPPGAGTSMLFSALDLEHLGQRITKLLGLWKRGSDPVSLNKQ